MQLATLYGVWRQLSLTRDDECINDLLPQTLNALVLGGGPMLD
jgi:hypothetical protein